MQTTTEREEYNRFGIWGRDSTGSQTSMYCMYSNHAASQQQIVIMPLDSHNLLDSILLQLVLLRSRHENSMNLTTSNTSDITEDMK
jgi:hypothetical protein